VILTFYLLLMLLYYETEISKIQKRLNCYIKKFELALTKVPNCEIHQKWQTLAVKFERFFELNVLVLAKLCTIGLIHERNFAQISQLPILNNAGAYLREVKFSMACSCPH
jgi:hypothetical protein